MRINVEDVELPYVHICNKDEIVKLSIKLFIRTNVTIGDLKAHLKRDILTVDDVKAVMDIKSRLGDENANLRQITLFDDDNFIIPVGNDLIFDVAMSFKTYMCLSDIKEISNKVHSDVYTISSILSVEQVMVPDSESKLV